MNSNRIFIIAEAGVNHNGSLNMAIELIDAAVAANADAVKFQTFKSTSLVSRHAAKAGYQILSTGNAESQLEMVRRLELDENTHKALAAHCVKRGIQFLSTPFDLASAAFLVKTLNVPTIKIPSGEITNGPLLLGIARLGRPVILSTGMSTLAEIEAALSVLAFGYLESGVAPCREAIEAAFLSSLGQCALIDKVTLLHCTTEYPAPFAEVNLRALHTLRTAFGLPVGYSDHTEGIAIPLAAAAMGAGIIEKHFTLDRDLPGPDHKASLEPDQLALMVASVRQVEVSLGNGNKIPGASELKNRITARQSLVAERKIAAGELFTADNLTTRRAGAGMSPMRYWELLGTPSSRDYLPDQSI